MSEKNATGEFYYSGYDNSVHQGTSYTGYSIWDTFRSEWAFINLFAPERVNGMIQSMLQSFSEGGEEGRLPMWLNIVETNIMIGTHSSSLIAESMAKGFKGFDMDLMWQAIYKDAMVPPDDDLTTMYYDREEGTGCEARAGLTRELELGYVAAIQTSEAGSRTLEYAYDDYTVSVIAKILGKEDDAKYFLERSKNYKNIWNEDTLFMDAKYENGTWCRNPSVWTEADNWVYTFNVQHDFAGLRDLFGGADALGKKLDEYYTGGHNDQTNEPSHATVYAYFYANQPAKAQSTIRSLLSENYFNSPVGLSGNDDCGQMSSWYVLNALGMYPMNPASAEYVVSTPLFDQATVKFPQSDATLTITAKGAQSSPYVAGVSVDGVAISKPVFTHEMILSAKEIVFEMSAEPQTWGANQL
jgi:predicted alpha-1,2-mannosidase